MSSRVIAENQVVAAVRQGLKIAVVAPCFNVDRHIRDMVDTLPAYVWRVYLVDDASLDHTAEVLAELSANRPQVRVMRHARNQGVGGATLTGWSAAYAEGADLFVKMDGDGQMDPAYLPLLVEPLVAGQADYTKGNRLRNMKLVAQMPLARRLGNAALSLLAKFASGYWNSVDPTNGYLAMRREIYELLPAKLLSRRFFFETSLLIALGILGAVVLDVPIPARYGAQKSSLHIGRILIEFPPRLLLGFLRRLWERKILYTLTIEALLTVFGAGLVGGGVIFGLIEFTHYAIILRTPAPAGTVMTAALPIFLGFQMLLNAILLDIQAVPQKPYCERFQRAEMREMPRD